MTLAFGDRRLHIGHDGRRYPSRTIAACDLHIRQLTARIKACKDPITALRYEADRDAVLEIRLWLEKR